MYASQWQAMRGFRRDPSVGKQHLTPGTMRRIAGYARPYRADLTIFLSVAVIDSLVTVSYPVLLAVIIDRGILPRRQDVVLAVAGAIVALALFDAFIGVVLRCYNARVGEGLIFDLRTQVFAHVQRLSVPFAMRTQTGALVSRLNSDVIGAQQALTSTLASLVTSVLQLVLVLATMLYFSWLVTLVAVALAPIFLFLARRTGRRLQRLTRESMQLDAEIGSTMTERFDVAGMMLARLYGRPREETGMFSSRAARVREVGVTTAIFGWTLFVTLNLLTSLATAVIYGVGGDLVIHRVFQLGALVALIALLTSLYGPITSLSNVQVNVMTALVSFERVFEVLDLRPLVGEQPGAISLVCARQSPGSADVQSPSIQFDHVSFHYPAASEVSLASLESISSPVAKAEGADESVLRDISFAAAPGQLTALVGPSGAGKTTIALLSARLYDPVEGAVRIGGRDLREVTLDSLGAAVGMVTQDAHMFHDTIRANLLYAQPGASEMELIEACREAQIWPLISTLPERLDTVVGDRGYRLSGGEKQRIALARLFLKSPSVVLLDEATAHMDSELEAAVQHAMTTVLAGRTQLVIAHRLSTVRSADQILVLRAGEIRERGRHEELLAAEGLYSELQRTGVPRL